MSPARTGRDALQIDPPGEPAPESKRALGYGSKLPRGGGWSGPLVVGVGEE